MPYDLLKLKADTEQLVLLDLTLQDSLMMFCEIHISVILFEKREHLWGALVDVEAPGTDVSFFEIDYIFEDDKPVVLNYTTHKQNPYTRSIP